MEDLITEVRGGKMSKETLETLRAARKDYTKIDEYHQEFHELNRDLRDSQIGKTQLDKTIKKEDGTKALKKAIRIPASYQNKVVRTGVAFEFGEPVTLIPSQENDLTQEVSRLWEVNRIDSKIQKLKVLQRSETQAALLFYTKTIDASDAINKKLGKNKNLEIKCKVLSFKKGQFYPVFDEYGDMIMFVWEFKVKKGGKDVSNTWIYDKENLSKYQEEKFIETDTHGFGKIPAVYFSQEKPEYFEVKDAIDRLETVMSKLAASNNYSGHPMLFTVGEVTGMPDRDTDGKMLNAPIDAREDEDGKPIHGDAKFLTHDNAPASVKIEIDELKEMIFSLTSTPNLSFNNLKGIGNVSGVALKLMFLDSILKAKMNEGDNRTDIQRMVNILISGIITSTNMKMDGKQEELYYDVKFGSVIPSDLKELVETLSKGVESNIISIETAVNELAIVDDIANELNMIKTSIESKEKTDNKPKVETE